MDFGIYSKYDQLTEKRGVAVPTAYFQIRASVIVRPVGELLILDLKEEGHVWRYCCCNCFAM